MAHKWQRVERIDSPYNQLEVWTNGARVDFEVAGATHATWHPHELCTGMAWDAITAGCLLKNDRPPESLLMLGLGGGTALRQLRHLLPDLRITTVEIDPEIVAHARTYMAIDHLDLDIVVGDAYAYLQSTGAVFDVIVDDVYRGESEDVARPVAYNPAWMQHIRNRLLPGGIFVMNLVTGAGHRQTQSDTRKIFCDTFDAVRAVRPPDSLNEILVGGDALGLPRQVSMHTAAWASPKDHERWEGLRVRKLK